MGIEYEYATGYQNWYSDNEYTLQPKYREPDEETAREEARRSQENGDGLVAMRIPIAEWELINE